ncbi:hypothetical protein DFH06DRAFT_536062 [Mycena polygramma]|nr:hypothetical protein DFH06DRAFT_536062 [Mycena polygramma]
MATLPQELIDAIVHELDDNKSLRTCSLVGPAFRRPSQRMLLRSLTLGDTTTLGDTCVGKPYTVALAFLNESPYIAPYFNRLDCMLPTVDAAPGEIQALSAILPILRNVWYCHFTGRRKPMGIVPQSWDNIPLPVSAAVLGVIQRGSLKSLDVRYIALPPAVLKMCFEAAPTLSRRLTSVEGTSHACPSSRIFTVWDPRTRLTCFYRASLSRRGQISGSCGGFRRAGTETG